MRGRVLILLGLIILGGAAVGAILILGGDDPPVTENGTPGATISDDGTNDPGPGPTNESPPDVGPANYVSLVIAAQNVSRGTRVTQDNLSSSGNAGFDITWSNIPIPPGFSFDPDTVIELTPGNPDDLNREMEELLVGCVARTDIPRGTPITRSQLTRDPFSPATTACPIVSGLSRRGSDAALFLDQDRVAIAVPLAPTGLGQVAYGFQPGDRIDVIMSFLFIDVDEDFQTRLPNRITILTVLEDGSLGFAAGVEGRAVPSPIFEQGVVEGPNEPQQRPRLVTQRTILDAEVVHVGWFPEGGQIYGATPTLIELPTIDPAAIQGSGQNQSNVQVSTVIIPTDYIPLIMTISVTPQEAVMLTWATDSKIPITYVLRSASALSPGQGGDGAGQINDQTEAVTLEYITGLFDIQDPPKLPISIEPAITDIRRFNLEDLTLFTQGYVIFEGLEE